MKPAQSLIVLAAMTALASLAAETSKTDAPSTPAKPAPAYGSAANKKGAKGKPEKTPEELAEAKAAKNEVHTLAVLDLDVSGREEQILIELFPDDAPKTVANFIDNIKKGTYKGVAVHRTIADYLVQTGDPASKDKAAREKWGTSQEYTIPGEFSKKHEEGSVAMARRSDKVNPKHDSDGTQFYFTLGNMSALNGTYSVFGKVVSGLDVIKRISHSVADSNDCPLARIEIKDTRMTEQKGPIVTMVTTPHGNKRQTRPEALKGPVEKFLERIW